MMNGVLPGTAVLHSTFGIRSLYLEVFKLVKGRFRCVVTVSLFGTVFTGLFELTREGMAEQHMILTSEQAISRSNQLTGLGTLSTANPVTRRHRIEQSKTPFLWRQIVGREAWWIEYDNLSLRLKAAVPGFGDPYRRHFTVILDANTAQCLGVSSTSQAEDPEMRPEPPAEVAETQLRGEKEIYSGLPPQDPKLTFLEALETILSKGVGSPFLAKEIDGVHVMESKMASDFRPVWVISLRGLPPRAVHRAGVFVPIWQRNHMRNVVDALSGTVLFATNSPQPQ
jgi:hypothetical protein